MKDKFLEILDELIEMDYDEFHKSLKKHEPGDIAEFIITAGAVEAIFSSVKKSDEFITSSAEDFEIRLPQELSAPKQLSLLYSHSQYAKSDTDISTAFNTAVESENRSIKWATA